MAHPLSRYTRNLLRAAFRKSCPEHFQLFLDWPKIIGPEFASFCFLQKVTFPPSQKREGRLYVKAPSSLSAKVSFSKAILIERANIYFGYPAIAELSVVQMPPKLTNTLKPTQKANSPLPECPKPHKKLDKIQDPQLKEAFENLMQTFLSKDNK